MLALQEQYQRLGAIADTHEVLQALFRRFASLVDASLRNASPPLKGLSVCLHPDENYFDVTFTGRTLRFAFSSYLEPAGDLRGLVEYRQVETLHEQTTKIGRFTFTPTGTTDLRERTGEGAENTPVSLQASEEATALVLHVLFSLLTHCPTASLHPGAAGPGSGPAGPSPKFV
jgi:hypothetical protein